MKKKVLFIFTMPPTKITNGGGQADKRCMTLAKEVFDSSEIDFAFINQQGGEFSLAQRITRSLFVPFGYFNGLTPSIMKALVRKALDYPHVFLSSSLYGIVAKELRSKGFKGKITIHFHNIESEYFKALKGSGTYLNWIKVRQAARNDALSSQYADNVITLNERDSNMLHRLYGRQADRILPISLPDTCKDAVRDEQQLTAKRPRCLFIGSFFSANVSGILWFVNNVLPHVDIDLSIVGQGMTQIKESVPESFSITADVESLAPYIEEADFIIMPIFSGSGMKVKTCEALMHGKNIIGTQEAFEGYDIDPQKVGALCNNAQDFIAAIKRFAEHPVPKWNSYSRQLFLEKYSLEKSKALFRSTFS